MFTKKEGEAMDTLIAYSSKYGSTEKCAHLLADQLEGAVTFLNLKTDAAESLQPYDTVVIGGPIYAGRIRKEVTSFCLEHMNELKTKRLGLFICGMQEEHTIQEELKNSFPQELRESAVVSAHFGGAYDFEKMGFIDRTIVKKIAKATSSQSDIKEETIAEFAKKLNAAAKWGPG